MLSNLTIKDFMSELASGEPVPGGGGAAALSAATACSLVAMVASLTVGKKGYETVADEMDEIKSTMETLSSKFLLMMEEDADAYGDVIAAFRMPKENDTEQKSRKEAIQLAMTKATLVPMNLAELAMTIFPHATKVIEQGNQNASSDGAVGALFARTAVLGALYNVKINLSMITEESIKKDMISRVVRLEQEAAYLESSVLNRFAQKTEDL